MGGKRRRTGPVCAVSRVLGRALGKPRVWECRAPRRDPADAPTRARGSGPREQARRTGAGRRISARGPAGSDQIGLEGAARASRKRPSSTGARLSPSNPAAGAGTATAGVIATSSDSAKGVSSAAA